MINNNKGFTLFEVLMVVFLLGAIAVATAVNFESLFVKDPLFECEDAFQVALGEGRMLSFENKISLEFTWDEDGRRFVLIDDTVVRSYEVEGLEDKKLKAVFYIREALQKGSSFDDARWLEIESVTLYGDATVTPFKLVISMDGRERVFVVEPFSGQVLTSS